MNVLVVAEDKKVREEVRDAVLEALHGKGICFTVSHEEGFGCCIRIQPDLIIVCDYDEALTPPTTHGIGWRSYNRIKEYVSANRIIRMGAKYFRYENYAQSIDSLKALVYMQH